MCGDIWACSGHCITWSILVIVCFSYGADNHSIETDDSSSVGETIELDLDSQLISRKKKSKWDSFTDCICVDWREALSRYYTRQCLLLYQTNFCFTW